jgi:uncharacterized membrane protein YphA (DoxX/SURF4 family)
MKSKKSIKIFYWITTTLASASFLMGGIQELRHSQGMVDTMLMLHYPEYMLNILGTAKLFGVVALILPVLPRLKEWAYAGFVIDLTGAIWSHNATGDHIGSIIPLVPLFIVIVSYILYRKLQVSRETKIA